MALFLFPAPSVAQVSSNTQAQSETAVVGETATSEAAAEQPPQGSASASCAGLWGIDFNCVWKSVMSWFGSWFLTMGGAVLLVAGTVFDWFLNLLVIGFGKTIQDLHIMEGIQRAWTLFRDISNIGMIGIFVFVAIMTILGNAEYGAKRLISRVLIVAVLINFSLLFTRIIVESTNFVSGQFARAMPGYTEERGPDTAQSFLKTFGMENVWSESKRLTDRAAASSDSGWAGFFYGLVGGITLLAISGVLFYGAFIMSARALLLIFAMLTSAIAFASFLLPNTAQQPFIGWSAWWSNLLKAALFGPILMIFLWITMTILDGAQLQAKGAGRAIGALADDPSKMTDATAWGSIILLLIATGLLFMAIRMAGSFSSSIGGFDWAAMGPAMGISFGAKLSAFAGRQTVGRAGIRIGDRLQEASKDTTKPLWARQLYDFSSQQFKDIGKKEMNVLRGTVGGELQRLTGMKKDALAGKTIKGFEGSEKERAKRYAEQADRMKLDEKETEKIAGKALAQVIKDNPGLGQQHTENSKSADEAEGRVKELEKTQAEAIDRFAQTLKTSTRELEDAQRNGRPRDEIERLEQQVQRQRADHQAAMNSEKRRIDDAKLIATSARKQEAKTKDQLVALAKDKGIYPKDVANLAKDITHQRFSNTLARAVGWSTEDNDKLAKAAAKQIGENKKKKDAKSVADVLKTFAGDDHGSEKTKTGEVDKKDAH